MQRHLPNIYPAYNRNYRETMATTAQPSAMDLLRTSHPTHSTANDAVIPEQPTASAPTKSWIRRIVSSSTIGLKSVANAAHSTDAHLKPSLPIESPVDQAEHEAFNKDIDSILTQPHPSIEASAESPKLPVAVLPADAPQDTTDTTHEPTTKVSGAEAGDKIIGKLGVRVVEARRLCGGGKVLNMKSLRPHCVAQVGKTAYISMQGERAVAPEADGDREGNRFVWHEHSGKFSFDISDFRNDLRLFVLSKNRLDNVIGQVLLPLPFLFHHQPVGINALWESQQQMAISGWFQLFPLAKDCVNKFRPAAPTVSKTGMKNSLPLGFIKLDIELTLVEPKPLWTLYLNPTGPNPQESTTQKQAQTKLINSVFAMMEASRELRRNLLRYRIAKNHIFSVYLLGICEAVEYLRSWESPGLSLTCITLTFLLFKSAQLWQLPFIAFALLAMSCVGVLRKRKLAMGWTNVDNVSSQKPERPSDATEDDFIIWNSDIQDPRAALNLWQKCALAVSQLNLVQEYIGWVSSILEKCINALNFADPHATSAVLMYAFAWACVASALLKALSRIFTAISPLHLALSLAAIYMSPPQLRAYRHSPQDDKHSKIFEAIRIASVALWRHIPDTNEMGHRFIARRQLVSTLSLLWDTQRGSRSSQTKNNSQQTRQQTNNTHRKRQKTLEEVMSDRIKIIRGESVIPEQVLKLQQDSKVLWSIVRNEQEPCTKGSSVKSFEQNPAMNKDVSPLEVQREAEDLLRKEVITEEEYRQVVSSSEPASAGLFDKHSFLTNGTVELRKEKPASRGIQLTRKAKSWIHSRWKGPQSDDKLSGMDR